MTRHGKGVAPTSSMGKRSSNRIPDSITPGTTQQTEENQEVGNSFAREAVGQIETLVESFRTGKTKKSQTIFKIGQILAAESTEDEQLKSDALDQYTSTLDRIETISAQSNERGMRVTSPVLGKRKDDLGKGNQPHETLDRNISRISHAIAIDDFIDRVSNGDRFPEGESDPGGGSDSGDEPDDGHNERGRSNKKQRIFKSQMPWFNKEQRIRRSSTNPSCNKTKNILDIFQRDPVTVKKWIRCASSAPAGFPSTEWDALIKGETVDLDTIFSSLHHVHSVDEGIGRVGSTEIQFGRPKPAAKVETSGQWTAAFNSLVKATSFLFPHRYDELRQYGDYMEELFSAKSTAIHPKLFKYDEAIRYKVGQGQNIVLTDRGEFTRYYEAIVASDGVGTQEASEGSQRSSGKSSKPREKLDICHRFNGTNGCSATAEKCRYKHICKRCKSRGHGKMDCKVVEGM